MAGIYAGYEARVNYLDEDSEVGGAGTLGVNIGGALVAIDSEPNVTPDISEPRSFHAGLGSRVSMFHTFIKHEAGFSLSGKLQNATFISLILNENYSYSFPIRVLKTNQVIFHEFLGSKPNTLKVNINRDEPVTFDFDFLCREYRDDSTFTQAGLDADIIANMDDNEAIQWTSDAAGDVGNYLLVIGLDTDDATWKYEIIGPLLIAGNYVDGAVLWSGGARDVIGAVLLDSSTLNDSVAAIGNIDIQSATGLTNIMAMVPTELSQGVVICAPDNGYYAQDLVVNQVADGATVKEVVYVGIDTSDDYQTEAVTLTGAVEAVTTNTFRTVYYVCVGQVEAARTITFGDYSIDPNASWAVPIATSLYTRRNVTVSRLIYVTGEIPAGAINGANQTYTLANFPIADYDRDGTVDDNGDLITLTIDTVDDLPPTSLDSSTGVITVTTAPTASIFVDYIYVDTIESFQEGSIEISNNQKAVWGQYTTTNTSPELARKIQHTGLDVKCNYKFDMEDLEEELDWLLNEGVVTVASGAARIWGIEFKFGTSEAGTFKIWAMDGYWEKEDFDLGEIDLIEEGIDFIADDFDIF